MFVGEILQHSVERLFEEMKVADERKRWWAGWTLSGALFSEFVNKNKSEEKREREPCNCASLHG